MRGDKDDGLAKIAAGLEALRTDMATVREQGSLTVDLLRALIALLTPKEDGRASLDEILATLIAQLRDMNETLDEAVAGIRRLEVQAPNGAGHGGSPAAGRARS